jgi:hypothetical protein
MPDGWDEHDDALEPALEPAFAGGLTPLKDAPTKRSIITAVDLIFAFCVNLSHRDTDHCKPAVQRGE